MSGACRIGAVVEAVFGCVPARLVDNFAALAPLVGESRARAIVETTGFATRRVANPGTDVVDLALPAAERALEGVDRASVKAVVSVSFSRRRRFPALAAALQHALDLPQSAAAVDLSLACAGFPYALFVAAQFAAALGGRALLVDGDVQSAFTDPSDAATAAVMGDAATATLLSSPPDAPAAEFRFLTDGAGADALACEDRIRMDGLAVYRFVAGPVRRLLAGFGVDYGLFVPHLANVYMARRLAEDLGLSDRLALAPAEGGNTGSSSVPLALAARPAGAPPPGRALLAGFGAGLSAAAVALEPGPYRRGVLTLGDDFRATCEPGFHQLAECVK